MHEKHIERICGCSIGEAIARSCRLTAVRRAIAVTASSAAAAGVTTMSGFVVVRRINQAVGAVVESSL
jgi:hypothetical protein